MPNIGETKHERFRRLAESRTKKALKALSVIINLSSNQYTSTPEEQSKIVETLRQKVQDIENSFRVRVKRIEEFNL